MTKHTMGGGAPKPAEQEFRGAEDQLCLHSHYATIVQAQEDVEIYQHGDSNCSSCLRRMAEKHEALAEIFRGRLAEQSLTSRGAAVSHRETP